MNLLYIHGNLSKKVMQFFTFMRICYYICNICRFILFLEFYFIIKNLTNLKFNLKIIKLLIIKLILLYYKIKIIIVYYFLDEYIN